MIEGIKDVSGFDFVVTRTQKSMPDGQRGYLYVANIWGKMFGPQAKE
jgi:hypothetical protein